ncbi:MAG TPA: protein-disulfide reductase DsbD [Noviherbaspirillum sp.]
MLARSAALLLLLLAPHLHAQNFLEPEQAFRFSARMVGQDTAEVRFRIADGYYMYRERFDFKAEGARLGQASIPPGTVRFDQTFQKDVETYRDEVVIRLPVAANSDFSLHVTSQGCSDQGLCYVPMNSTVRLQPLAAKTSAFMDSPQGDAGTGPEMDGLGSVEASLASGRLAIVIPLFMLLGLGLSLTPCVLPMVPILSSIILGDGAHVSRMRGFVLSAAYSLGMALVYTGMGIAAGLAGEGLAASLQTPWALTLFATLMVALSLSMFGLYQLQVPAALQTRLSQASDRQRAGKLAGVFAMGAISALIVGPCVAAPLAGALMYISQTRDVVLGGAALFSMALGMSVPLLLVGLSAGTLLPRAGAWMEAVKKFFGVLMLALAAWIIAPVVPRWAAMAAWSVLGLGYALYLLRRRNGSALRLAAGLLFLVLGGLQILGLATGGRDALAPLAHLSGEAHSTKFRRVHSVAELDAVLAASGGRTVMLDFYADWCVSCIEMEKFTFSDSRVRRQFDDMILLQADVTANSEDDKALLRRFRLFGPPGIIFFDIQGREIAGARVIGFQNADRFNATLTRVNAP